MNYLTILKQFNESIVKENRRLYNLYKNILKESDEESVDNLNLDNLEDEEDTVKEGCRKDRRVREDADAVKFDFSNYKKDAKEFFSTESDEEDEEDEGRVEITHKVQEGCKKVKKVKSESGEDAIGFAKKNGKPLDEFLREDDEDETEEETEEVVEEDEDEDEVAPTVKEGCKKVKKVKSEAIDLLDDKFKVTYNESEDEEDCDCEDEEEVVEEDEETEDETEDEVSESGEDAIGFAKKNGKPLDEFLREDDEETEEDEVVEEDEDETEEETEEVVEETEDETEDEVISTVKEGCKKVKKVKSESGEDAIGFAKKNGKPLDEFLREDDEETEEDEVVEEDETEDETEEVVEEDETEEETEEEDSVSLGEMSDSAELNAHDKEEQLAIESFVKKNKNLFK